MSASAEWVQVVDHLNRPCGAVRRGIMRRYGMWHRASYIFVINADKQICVQTRTPTKDLWPGAYDLCAGGVVAAGEAMHVGAQRELAEELGIRGVPLQRCFEFAFAEQGVHVFGEVYLVRYSGPLALQASEVAAVGWYSVHEALTLKPVTLDSRAALQRLDSEGWLKASA